MAKQKLVWKKKAEDGDLKNAANYLSLIFSDAKVKKLVRGLRKAEAIEHAAKDLLRASGLPLLPHDNPHVSGDLHKIHNGKPIAPVMLVRGDAQTGRRLIVADGYHRICAVYYFDENAAIVCRMTSDPDL
jgi:hypothetical protein